LTRKSQMKSNNPTAGKKSSKPAESASRMVELWAAPGIVALSTFFGFSRRTR
jgi:hypothetical protein